MTWVLKDEHEFRTEEVMKEYFRYQRLAEIWAMCGLLIGGPISLALLVYIIFDVMGLKAFIASIQPHSPLAIWPIAFIPFLSFMPAVLYYSKRAKRIHESDDVKCYQEHRKKKRKDDDQGPTTYVSLPSPSVRI